MGCHGVGDSDLFVFGGFVVLKEAFHLTHGVGGELVVMVIIRVCRVDDVDGNDLVVESLFVAHAHHTNGAGLDDGEGLDGLLTQDEDIERVAVIAVGAGDETVVRRVVDSGIENAIEAHEPGLFVEFVLVLAALGDLDHHREAALNKFLVKVDIVPGMHGLLHGAMVKGGEKWVAAAGAT